ncbi:hypothetical protein AGLY_005796 [Aphis glycines]|uniref:Uncharacterized protein n=1 Tax=Aphis glycines TaxID=307491 RepID=A0A6G0TS36_APHGL|nr:hypothetical protein AGLY_005796 [Aphis glycines]
MYSYNFSIIIRITYEELCIKFSNKSLSLRDLVNISNSNAHNIFFYYDVSSFLCSYLMEIYEKLLFELQPYNKNRFGRKLVLRKNFRYSLCHRKPLLKFKIEALFRLIQPYTDAKKHTSLYRINTIHSSLCSESKIQYNFYFMYFVFFPLCPALPESKDSPVLKKNIRYLEVSVRVASTPAGVLTPDII